ncbi:MAG: hypothetical protein ACRDLL_12255 [Solirubrobacterales bacterium]
MRSHAKASSAGSSMRQAAGLGRIVRGAFLSRGAFGEADGSGARSAKRFCAAACLALVGSVLWAGNALAAEQHPFESSFGTFTNIQSLAVDQANGNLYALDIGGEKSVSRSDSEGNPVNFSASAPYISGNTLTGTSGGGFSISGGPDETQVAIAPPGSPGGTAGNIYVAESNAGSVAVFAPSGQFLGKIDGSGNTTSHSGGEICGVATDPAGNLYLGYFSQHIDKYVPTVNPPLNSDFNSTIFGVGGICNIAASSDHVFGIKWSQGPITSYPLSLFPGGGGEADASAAGTVISDESAPVSTAAVDASNDDLYLDELTRIAQLSSAGSLIGRSSSGSTTGSRGVAIDSSGTASDGNLYASSGGTKVEIYGPPTTLPDATTEAASEIHRTTATLNGKVSAAGGPDATCEFQYVTQAHFTAEGFQGASPAPCSPAGPFTGSGIETVSAAISGLAVDTAYRFRLLAESANGTNSGATLSFTTPHAVNAETNPATQVTGASATLNGTINPEGVELAECKFEYGTSASYGQSVPCAESPAAIGSGNSPAPVHADISSLNGGTDYHFRVVAKNSFGSRAGLDANLTTHGPLLQSQSVSHVSNTSARLEATINPSGEETSFLFEYVTQAEFEISGYADATKLPEGGEAIGSGTDDVRVSQQVSGLQPSATYHFRVIASSPGGTAVGADETFLTYPSPPIFGPCANDDLRTGPSGNLPDCRAYEQVSEIDKNGGDVSGGAMIVKASLAGDAITFDNLGGLPGGAGAQDWPMYIARREGGQWDTRGLLPPPNLATRASVVGLTPDLLYSFTRATTYVPEVASGTLLRRSSDISIETLAPFKASAYSWRFDGSSADDSKIYFDSRTKYTPDAAAGHPNIYVWDRDTGAISLVGAIPTAPDTECNSSGPACVVPAAGTFGGTFRWFTGTDATSLETSASLSRYAVPEMNAISVSGDRAYFTAGETGQIYLREDPTEADATTAQVSASKRTTPDPNGSKPAIFYYASKDGAAAIFSSCEKLTDDSTAVSTAANRCDTTEQGQDLYRYDADGRELTDLTPNAPGPRGAAVAGVIGTDDSGSYVYFAASGDLDGSGPAEQGGCETFEQSCNLYLAHNGAIAFIAKIDYAGSPSELWQPGPGVNFINGGSRSAVVSADGSSLVFLSRSRLTSFDNDDANALYRYNADQGALDCISCSTVANGAEARLQSIDSPGQITPDSGFATIPRTVSADGDRVFFETPSKLVAADVNGDVECPGIDLTGGFAWACQDVYEWEAQGAGSCTTEGGCIYLLSTGTSSAPAYFGDASASGDDVFIFTHDQLVPQDKDQLVDVYDVSVGGGLAYQHTVEPPPCDGEACRGAGSSVPEASGASTAAFAGAGDPPPNRRVSCPKGKRKVLAKGRTRCRRPHKHSHKRRKQKRNANTNRRASR